jgi:hypothetical protein
LLLRRWKLIIRLAIFHPLGNSAFNFLISSLLRLFSFGHSLYPISRGHNKLFFFLSI